MSVGLDTAVENVASKAVNELVQFVAKNIDLVVGIDSEIIDLTSDIETFNARLVDASETVHELVQFVAKNIDLVVGIDSEIIGLTSDIETFNARLVDASKMPRAKELQIMKVIVKKFRAVVDEAKDAIESVIDKYLAEKKNHEGKTFTKCFHKLPHYWNVNAFASEIRSIRVKIKAILQNHERDLMFVMKHPNSGQNSDQSHFQTY